MKALPNQKRTIMTITTNSKAIVQGIDRRVLIKLTKHLVLAAPRLKKVEEPSWSLLQRYFPKPIKPVVKVAEKKIEKKVEEPKQPEYYFDLGKITKFTMDKSITFVECAGKDMPVRIKKGNEIFVSDMKLTEEEIEYVLDKFSKEANVSLDTVFRANARSLSITAILSPSFGSSFVIRRILE